MTFEKQVKTAKEKQLQNRIVRDIIFLMLGITFLTFSIFSAIKENKKDNTNKASVTTKINK